MEFAPGWAVPSAEPHGPSAEDIAIVCEACGESNSSRARFCQRCGAPLAAVAEPAAEAIAAIADPNQSIVTAVVCEVSPRSSGKEAQGEGTPEMWDAAGALDEMADTLQGIRAVLERYGGAVDNLGGSPNTLVAVFGPEPAAADGPLRAVRAAAEIREAIPATAAGDLALGSATAVLMRAGVGASEVMGSGPEASRLWEQRVVDLAVRLQRMADPGEVILGEGVYRRIGNAAAVQPVDGRARMDGGEPVGPLRLLEVVADPTATSLLEAPFIGREPELARLREAFHQVATDRVAATVWITGEAGIGKTRVAEEFLRDLEVEVAARVIRVRCRPPSEGGTMWPLADVVEQAAWVVDQDPPEEVRAKIHRLMGEGEETGRVAARLLPALGLPGGLAVAEETPWAIRRLLEAASPNGPLVVFVDDADRAGAGFARLLNDVVLRSREASLLLICAARSEPDGGGEATIIRVEPLSDVDLGSLVEELTANPETEPAFLDAIAQAAGRNPLATEQLLALLVDDGRLRFEHRRWVPAFDPFAPDPPLPNSGQAIVEDRLNALDPDQRATIQLVAVLGEAFSWTLVAALVPGDAREAFHERLVALSSKRLLRSDVSAPTGEEVFGFSHASLRSAAIAGMAEDVRADVHERFAGWLQDASGERPERHAELIGSHLESACRSRRRDGAPMDDSELPRRAAGMLASAGAAAAALGDPRGAVQLWLRASSLLSSDDPVQPQLLLETALSLADLGERPMAEGLLMQAARAARFSDDRAVEWRARLVRTRLGFAGGLDLDGLDALRETADSAVIAFRELGDDVGLAWAWSARGQVRRFRGHFAAAANAAEKAAEHARRAGRDRDEVAALRDMARAIVDGPAPVKDAMTRCQAILAAVRGRRPAEQEVATTLALLTARGGGLEQAREMAGRAATEVEALGLERELATCLLRAGQIEALGQELRTADRLMRQALELADRLGDAGMRGEIAASLAHVACDVSDLQGALEFTELAERDGDPGDLWTQVRWRSARAKVLAREGRPDEAKALARGAVQLADQTDLIDLRTGALLDLAEVLRLTERPNEALPFARRALRTLERKGAEAPAGRARALLEEIEPRAAERVG
jgi:tetratricopeptide (TPR) repeat protein